MKKRHNALRAIIFSLLALFLLNIIGRYISIFAVNGQLFWRTADFYREDKGSLDAVLVGPSSTYAFWEPNTAWTEYGIACYPFATAQQPLCATRFVVEECRKTQPDCLYLININLFLVEGVTPAQIHFLSDTMPPSINRHNMIQYMCELGGYDTFDQQLEYYHPVFAMHSRWKRVHLPPKGTSGMGCKGASVDKGFINDNQDVTDMLYLTEERGSLPEATKNELQVLFDYLEREDVNVVFFLSPSGYRVDTMVNINSLCDYIEDAGYKLYNGLEDFDEIGLYPATDFMDFSHTNLPGAVKFTKWLGQKLIADYGFADKRGNADYASWDEAASRYDRVVSISKVY